MKLLQSVRKKNIQKRILAACLLAVVLFADYQAVLATKIDDAKGKREEAQENLNEVNAQIEEIKDEQSALQEEMEAYDEQLMILLTDMDLLESDITAKEAEIARANADLDAAKEREQTQYEAMKMRIQYMYENGDASIWTAIAEAENITDFLNRVEYVSDVYLYDRKQLDAYQETVQQIADLTEELNMDLAEMEELELNYEEQKGELESVIAEKNAQMDDFTEKLAEAKSLAGQYAATIRQQNQIIASEEARIAAERAARERAEREAAEKAAAAANNTGSEGTSNASSGGDSGDSGTGLTTSGLNPSYSTGVSGSDVVAYAEQFVGNPYVYGGNSLTEGCDCSYFVMACFGQYGISLPRSSYKMQNVGQAVSYDCAQAGDIICYSGHVAIYMGNGKIVHASSPKNGICYGTATYRTIVTIRRVL